MSHTLFQAIHQIKSIICKDDISGESYHNSSILIVNDIQIRVSKKYK